MVFDEGAAALPREPQPTPLRRILEEKPEERQRVGRAIVALGATTLVAIVAISGLLIWHLLRRGRLIRERLAPPNPTRLLDFSDDSPEQRPVSEP